MTYTCRLALVATTLAVLPAVASAQQATRDIDIGQREFEANCAVCHGVSGKGDGPMAGYLTEKAADLTVLSKNNDGAFPFNEVYETIDGRKWVQAHGARDMPIWGRQYELAAREYYRDYPAPYDSEGFVRGRILALVSYIHDLQGK